jgi:hypothetical protein
LLNERVAEDGPVVIAHACRLGAEGIVSKKVDGTYRSGPCRVWIKVRNPASMAVQRERSQIWNRSAGVGRQLAQQRFERPIACDPDLPPQSPSHGYDLDTLADESRSSPNWLLLNVASWLLAHLSRLARCTKWVG